MSFPKNHLRNSTLGILTLLSSACGIHESKVSPNSAVISNLVNDKSLQVSYADVNQAVIQTSCLSCHSSAAPSGGIALDNYASLSANILSVSAAIKNGSMPLDGSLTSDQKALIAKWVSEGHPETVSVSASPPSSTVVNVPANPSPTTAPIQNPDPVVPPTGAASVTYADINQQIIQPSCIACHDASDAMGGVVLDTYGNLSANILNVQTAVNNASMPQGSTLTAQQKTLLANWIAQGHPETAQTGPTQTGTTPPTPPSPTATPDASPTGTPIQVTNPGSTATAASVLVAIRNNFETSVKPLVQRGCMDCHNTNAVPTGWLGKLPIVREIEWKHIHQATKILDFNRSFPSWSATSSDPTYYLTQIRGALQSGSMPPKEFKDFHRHDGKLLSDAENKIILKWVSDSMAALASVNTSRPTAQAFFSTNCLGCHNSNLASGGFSFQTSGNDLLIPSGKSNQGIPYVSNHDPLNSAIYLVLLGDASARHGLAQMPMGGDASADDQKLIFDWIQSSP